MRTIMKDAPAFDFFPERWTHGTQGMTKVEKCDYLTLLLLQWTQDGIDNDLPMIATALGYLNGKGEGQPSKIPARVLTKFPASSDGKLRNDFLEEVRLAQRERIKTRRIGAAISNLKRHGIESLSPHDADLLRAAGKLPSESLEPRSATPERHATDLAEGSLSSHHHPPPTTHPSFQQQQPAGATPSESASSGILRLHPHCTQLEAEQWADHHNCNTTSGVRITPEIAVAWWEDRTRADWQYGKNGTLIPLKTCQAVEADIVSFARTWAKNETQPRPGFASSRNRPISPEALERIAKGAVNGF
jgi:hypothetical protein